MTQLPDWTEFTSDEVEHRGLDPLGLAAVGGSIVQRRLLPGITNTTKHIRYYSFFCWVFWTFWGQRGRHGRKSEQRKWRVRLENVFRAATLFKSPFVGELIGVTKALRVDNLAANELVRIDRDEAATAFIPANYSSSFRALGCGRWTSNGGAQLTPLGEELAEAFDTAVRNCVGSGRALTTILSDEPTVSVKAIKTIADGIWMRPVRPSEPEHGLLVELMLRLKNGDLGPASEFNEARSRSFGLLLEIAEQADGRITSSSDLHRIFAIGKLPSGRRFVPPKELDDDFEIWQRYQERQYLKIAIYSLWHEVVQMLAYRATKSAKGDELFVHFHKSLQTSEVAEKWFGRRHTDRTVSYLQKLMLQEMRRHPHDFGRWAMELTESLHDLQLPSAERVGGAVVLLFLCSSYWGESANRLTHSELHREGGRERISLDSVWVDIQQMQVATLSEYVWWTVENYVLKQATRIAVDKLPDYRFFIERDDAGYRLVKPQNPRSYLSYDPSRIESAYTLMSELKLIDLQEGFRVTPLGRSLLGRLRLHHRERLGVEAVRPASR
jgi:hypothetical protein